MTDHSKKTDKRLNSVDRLIEINDQAAAAHSKRSYFWALVVAIALSSFLGANGVYLIYQYNKGLVTDGVVLIEGLFISIFLLLVWFFFKLYKELFCD